MVTLSEDNRKYFLNKTPKAQAIGGIIDKFVYIKIKTF